MTLKFSSFWSDNWCNYSSGIFVGVIESEQMLARRRATQSATYTRKVSKCVNEHIALGRDAYCSKCGNPIAQVEEQYAEFDDDPWAFYSAYEVFDADDSVCVGVWLHDADLYDGNSITRLDLAKIEKERQEIEERLMSDFSLELDVGVYFVTEIS